jgi:hypothetical protein
VKLNDSENKVLNAYKIRKNIINGTLGDDEKKDLESPQGRTNPNDYEYQIARLKAGRENKIPIYTAGRADEVTPKETDPFIISLGSKDSDKFDLVVGKEVGDDENAILNSLTNGKVVAAYGDIYIKIGDKWFTVYGKTYNDAYDAIVKKSGKNTTNTTSKTNSIYSDLFDSSTASSKVDYSSLLTRG